MGKNTQIAELINYISVNGSGDIVMTGNIIMPGGAQAATQSYVNTAISNLVNAAPTALDTLKELATALNNDASFATTVTNSLATKLNLSGGTLTGQLSGTSASFSSSVTGSNFYAPSNTGFWSDTFDVRRNGFVADGTNLVFRAGNSSTGEQTRMVIVQASGNIGIGTASPGKRLEISEDNSSTTLTTGFKITNWSGITDTRAGIVFQNYDNNAAAIWSRRTGSIPGELIFGTNGGAGIGETNIIERMRLNSSGNLGIGTSSPDARLHISSTTAQLKISGNTNSFAIYSWNSGVNLFASENLYLGRDAALNNKFYFQNAAGSSTTMYVDTTGDKVAIGNTNPLEKFSVSGNVHIAGVGNVLYFDTDASGRTISQYVTNLYEFHILNGRGNSSRFVLGNGSISLGTSSTPQFFINTSSGNVGMGTTDFSNLAFGTTLLKIGGSRATLGLQSSGTLSTIALISSNSTSTAMHLNYENTGAFRWYNYSSASEIFTLLGNGNLGLSVTNPSHRLQVSGNIYSTDTVYARNLKPEGWASVSAGSPTSAGIPMGYSMITINSPCDGNWRTVLSNINDTKAFMWACVGDAASKDTASYTFQMTSPAYGVSSMAQLSYSDGGWNTGSFEFTYSNANGTHTLLVRCTSYYSSGNTAYGNIYFLRLE